MWTAKLEAFKNSITPNRIKVQCSNDLNQTWQQIDMPQGKSTLNSGL